MNPRHTTKTVEPAPHEYAANYIFDGLGGWFGASAATNATGSVTRDFSHEGDRWTAKLYFSEGGLAPPESGETPDGTEIRFDTIREFHLHVSANDGLGEKKAHFVIQPRWDGLKSKEEGKPVARPLWQLGDCINVKVNGANLPFDDYQPLLRRAADAVDLNTQYFSEKRRYEDFSNVYDAAFYVRIYENQSGPIHSRTGPISRMGHLLETDREGYRKVIQDDTERSGYYHTVTLGARRTREAFPDHQLPREIKHYYSRHSQSLDNDDPLAHPKLEAAYESGRWDETLRPRDHDKITKELREAVLAVLNEASLPTQAGLDGPDTFCPDHYFKAENTERADRVLPLALEKIEQDQNNVVVRQLANGLSPIQWDTISTLVTDGGQVGAGEIAESHGWHEDSVRRALRKMGELVERGHGTVSLKSHHVAEQVHEALEAAEQSVKNAVGAAAHALDKSERYDTATSELIAFCQANGYHIDEREANLKIRLGDLSGQDWHEVVHKLLQYWKEAGRDVLRFKNATTLYHNEAGGAVRPVRSHFTSGQSVSSKTR